MYRYKAGKTIFHKLGIGFKLIYMLTLFVLVFVSGDAKLLTALLLMHLVLLKLSGYKETIKLSFFIALFLIVPVGLLYLFILPKPIILYNMLARVFILIYFGALFTTTTDNIELLMLMKKLRFPEFIYIPMYVLIRFLPELEIDYKEIREMQKIKGIEFGLKPKRLKLYMKSLLIPLIILIIDRAREIAIVLYLKEEIKDY